MDSALLSSRDGYPLEPKSGLNGVKPPVAIQLSNTQVTTDKTVALTMQAFVSRVMPLLLNKMFKVSHRAFLTKSSCLLISWLQSPSAVILESKKRKSVTTSAFSSSICQEIFYYSRRTTTHA